MLLGAARVSESVRNDDHARSPWHAGGCLCWIGAAGIVAIAVMRCVVAFLPQTIFDVDPAGERTVVIASLGMGGSLLLDALLIVACLVALLGEWRGGRGLDPLLLTLALAPLPMVWWHGFTNAGDLWRGSTWAAAALACVTVAHLARQRNMRIALTASLLAVVVPMLARGVTQVTYEHDDMLADYRANRAVYLQQRGWEEDSPATRIFERRLEHREPTGWFTSTNLFGSIAGCAAIMFIGLAIVAMRSRMQSGWWFLMLMVAAACAAGLWITSSMGAMLATIAGGLVLAVIAFACRASGHRHAGGYVTGLLVAMIFGATLGVIARGALLPEGFFGEKSLLFRWHYLQAASEIVNAHTLTGVGPDGFQQAYTLHRPVRNPEEVQSAHAMFTDWLSTLGVLGGAWVALIVVMAARAGQSLMTPANPDPDATAALRPAVRFGSCVAALALAPAMLIEWQALIPIDVFVRGLTLAAYIAAAAMIAAVLVRCDDRWLRGVSIAGATVLLVHGQIEMTFFQNGSVVWCMAMVGMNAGRRQARSRGFNYAVGAIAMLAIVGWLGWLSWAGVLPALRQERLMLGAARLLDQVRNDPQNHEVILTQRPQAAKKLVEAYEAWPINVRPLNAAADQLFIAAAPPPPATTTAPTSARPADRSAGVALGLMADAADLVDRAVIEHNDPSSLALARTIHTTLAMLTDDTEQWAAALSVSRRLADGDPHGVQPWVRLGDVLWQAGERNEAKKAYQRALRNSDNFDLDALKQLSPRIREILERRIDEVGE
jgi:hypothetical protein